MTKFYFIFFYCWACGLSNSNALCRNYFRKGKTIIRSSYYASSYSSSWPSSTSTHVRERTLDLFRIYCGEHPSRIIEDLFSLLARTGKTKRRLRHLLDLAMECEVDRTGGSSSVIADIGCDHGILAFALAFSGKFSSVIGVDASDLALKNGALRNQKKIGSLKNGPSVAIDFRHGNGLTTLMDNEVNSICLAGMGVDTMMEVLFSTSSNSGISELERIGCQYIYVQPANPRPRHLVKLYDALQMAGYDLSKERIEEFISNKSHEHQWHITTAFVKRQQENTHNNLLHHKELRLPGEYLVTMDNSTHKDMYNAYVNYLNHHRRWIFADAFQERSSASIVLNNEDIRWLEKQPTTIT